MQVVLRSSSKMSSARRRAQASVLGREATERQQSLSSSSLRARLQSLQASSRSATTLRMSLRRLSNRLAKRQLSSISRNGEASRAGFSKSSFLRGRRASLLLQQFSETRRHFSLLMRSLNCPLSRRDSSSKLSRSSVAARPTRATSSAACAFTSWPTSIILMSTSATLSSEGSSSSTSPLSSCTSSTTHRISRTALYLPVTCSLMLTPFASRSTASTSPPTRAMNGTAGGLVQVALIAASPFAAYSRGRSSLLPARIINKSIFITDIMCSGWSGVRERAASHYIMQPDHFIVIIYSMLLNLRKKQSSSSVLNLTSPVDPAADESFVESTVSKRFARKKNSSNEHGRNLRGNRPLESCAAEGQGTGSEAVRAEKAGSNAIKPEDLFLRITHTPTKGKNSYTPASSDRATESTYLRSRYETEVMVQAGRREWPARLKEELELKTGELMLLEDELMRLKRELGSKQQEFLKASIRKEKEHQAELARLAEELQQVRAELQERSGQARQLRKGEAALLREVKALKYDKLLLEKQLDELYKKRLPKELRELMSFREASLGRQVEELRARVEESKSEHEAKLEAELLRLKREGSERAVTVKQLEVHTRILSRRIAEFEADLRVKNDSFGKFYLAMKESNNDLKEQLKKARKENLKLRRLHTLNHAHLHPYNRKITHHLHSSSEESLSLSFSSKD